MLFVSMTEQEQGCATTDFLESIEPGELIQDEIGRDKDTEQAIFAKYSSGLL